MTDPVTGQNCDVRAVSHPCNVFHEGIFSHMVTEWYRYFAREIIPQEFLLYFEFPNTLYLVTMPIYLVRLFAVSPPRYYPDHQVFLTTPAPKCFQRDNKDLLQIRIIWVTPQFILERFRNGLPAKCFEM